MKKENNWIFILKLMLIILTVVFLLFNIGSFFKQRRVKLLCPYDYFLINEKCIKEEVKSLGFGCKKGILKSDRCFEELDLELMCDDGFELQKDTCVKTVNRELCDNQLCTLNSLYKSCPKGFKESDKWCLLKEEPLAVCPSNSVLERDKCYRLISERPTVLNKCEEGYNEEDKGCVRRLTVKPRRVYEN